jgi:cyclophilin family peptidyl-prolyl cis-trans isomerase
MTRLLISITLLLTLGLGILASGTEASARRLLAQATVEGKSYDAPPEMAIDPDKTYIATMETSAGTMVLELLPQEAPMTVNNFVFLANEGFYEDVIFHRVIEGFMIQGGDPTGTGAGGPGYRFEDEPVQRPYTRGTLAMANAGPNTNGSQFFIMHADVPLPPAYTIFGSLIEGEEVLDAIATAATGPNDRPADPVVIDSVTIEEMDS